MAIASSDELHLLETKCSRLLADKLSIHNAVETWTIADKYSDHELRHKSFSLVRDVFDKLPPDSIAIDSSAGMSNTISRRHYVDSDYS